MPPAKNKGGSKADTKSKDKPDSGSGSGSKQKGAQSINCEKHSKKEEALAKIRDGVKFDDVARDFSEDKARQGGALGWKTKGSLDLEFEKIAFDLETSTVNAPKIGEAKTSFGYHIIMVEGRK